MSVKLNQIQTVEAGGVLDHLMHVFNFVNNLKCVKQKEIEAALEKALFDKYSIETTRFFFTKCLKIGNEFIK